MNQNKIIDLVEQLKKVDELINIHSDKDLQPDFTLSQYKDLKIKLFKELEEESLKTEKQKSFFKRYLFYHMKWQLGNIVGIPLFLFFEYLSIPSSLSLILFAFIGAILFYPIDCIIFKKK